MEDARAMLECRDDAETVEEEQARLDRKRLERRAAFVAGLRKMADAFEEHPEIPLSGENYGEPSLEYWVPVGSAKEPKVVLEAAARALPGKKEKKVDEFSFTLTADFGGGVTMDVYASRDAVCEKKVVGTKKVQKPLTRTETVGHEEVEEEIVEWDCGPVLTKATA